MAIQAAVNRTSREEYYFPSSKATTLSEDSAGAGRGAGLFRDAAALFTSQRARASLGQKCPFCVYCAGGTCRIRERDSGLVFEIIQADDSFLF